jgi:hypothetical protein
MWKLGLKPRYSFSMNICFEILVFCLCSACNCLKEISCFVSFITVSSFLFVCPKGEEKRVIWEDPVPQVQDQPGAAHNYLHREAALTTTCTEKQRSQLPAQRSSAHNYLHRETPLTTTCTEKHRSQLPAQRNTVHNYLHRETPLTTTCTEKHRSQLPAQRNTALQLPAQRNAAHNYLTQRNTAHNYLTQRNTAHKYLLRETKLTTTCSEKQSSQLPAQRNKAHNYLLREKPLTTTCTKKHWGGGLKSVVEMTVNKEQNSKDFCPNYVQEFGLWTLQSINASFMRDQSIAAIFF